MDSCSDLTKMMITYRSKYIDNYYLETAVSIVLIEVCSQQKEFRRKWEVFWPGDGAAQKTSTFQYSHYILMVDVVIYFLCYEFMIIYSYSSVLMI